MVKRFYACKIATNVLLSPTQISERSKPGSTRDQDGYSFVWVLSRGLVGSTNKALGKPQTNLDELPG